MTYLKDVFGRDLFKDFDKVFVGFDDQYARLARVQRDLAKQLPAFPHYDIVKTGDSTYKIQLAVAGFAQQDIDIELAGDQLIIKGNLNSDAENKESFLHKGIANRAFTRSFTLGDQIEIKGAEMLNGMLQVFLERMVPEDKKPKKISISEKKK